MQEMNGQIALVTGAGRGIGSAIAKSLAKEGATVIVNYAGNAQAAQDTVDSILRMAAVQKNISVMYQTSQRSRK